MGWPNVDDLERKRDVKGLIKALRQGGRNGEVVRNTAAQALGRMHNAWAVKPLIAALKDKDHRVSEMAAEALGKIDDVQAVEPLIATLRHPDRRVRGKAAQSLGQIGDPRAVAPLIAHLERKADDSRDAATFALGHIRDPRTVGPLVTALGDEDAYVHDMAFRGLIWIGRPAVEPLIAALKHRDDKVGRSAAQVLGSIGDPRAIEPLNAALKDEHPHIRGG
jgi:HEAT repeat protein